MKTRSRCANLLDDDRETETDESSLTISSSKRRKCISNKMVDHIQKYTRNGLSKISDLPHSIKRELETSRDTDQKSGISPHSNSNDTFANEDEKQNVRRSTRQRKFMYDNLNQTWLLAPSIPEFSSKFESLFARDPQNSSRDDGPVRRSVRNRSYELRRLGLTTEGLEFEDMYSRVKRKRRKTVHSFYTRRISQDAGSMADTEDTDRRDLSDSDTIDDQSDLEGAVATEFPAGIAVGESQEDTVVHGPSAVHGPKYSLRPKKPITKRFQFPIEPVRPRRSAGASIFEATHSRPRESFKSTAHRTHIFRRKRHAIHNSSSSSSSDDERRFEKRKVFSMARARNRCLPLNFVEEDLTKGALRDRIKIGSSLADVDPMAIDKTVTFDHIGGLDKHIQSLKEMVLFPLMYPEVFQRFNITPPRGVLFYGPPGTGKTLVARALANECCTGDKRVAFFMRKGADCLSKWVGESERQLRLLFDQAYTMRPSVIFFDEIDGLAPVRSTRQDQIHSSIVSTLLALMDGLDNRGEIVIIGATNRPDAIDPALRRPGRFDRELSFSLPSYQSRETILNILTGAWVPPLPRQLVSELAARTAGYCGADLKALCSEAGLVALRRRYPQIYHSKQKLMLDVESIQVQPVDFLCALKKMKPSMQRSSVVSSRPLPVLLKPLLEAMLQNVLFKISKIFPVFSLVENGNSWPASVIDTSSEDNYLYHEALPRLNHVSKTKVPSEAGSRLCGFSPLVHRPYFLLSGREGQGQGILAPAVLYLLENVSIHRLDIPTLYAVTCRSAEEACAQIFHEAQRDLPSVIFLPHIGYWWETLSETVKATFLSLLQDLDPSTPLLLFATSDVSFGQLDPKVQEIFGSSADQVFCMRNPTHDERRSFFSSLVHEIYKLPQRAPVEKAAEEEVLPVAPPPPVLRKLTAEELARLRQREEATLRELRVFLRDILTKLARDRRFSVFSRPVDPEEVPDYQEVIKNPMDLETMMTKIDRHRYETVAQFLSDIDLVCQNALEYNPDRDPSDKLIRHRACALKDAAHALVLTELDDEFEKICQCIQAARRERGEISSIALPDRSVPVERACAVPEEKKSEVKENGLPSPTRFSKRIRSMGCIDGQSPPKSFTSPKRTSRYMIWRRRKSPWFGSCRRKLIRRKIKCAGGPKKMKLQSGGAKFVKTSDPVQQENKIPEPAVVEDRKDASGTDSSATTVVSPALPSPEPHPGPGEQHPTSPSKCQSSCDISKELNCSRNWNGDFSTRQMDPASADDQRCANLTSDVCSINIDPMSLDCLVSQIVRFTENYPVEKLQQLYSMLQQCVYRHRRHHDKKDLLKEMEQSLDSFLHYKPS